MPVLSDVMEDYLKTVYQLQEETDPPISTSAVAEYLGVTPPTASSMLEKLADRGLLEREKYHGVELTAEGETVALEVLRHHRLLEAYLAEHLDYDWDEVHDEADALEHHISEEFERRISAVLNDPNTDPHGDPIPSPDLEPPTETDTTPLTDCAVGDHVVVARVRDRRDEELTYLSNAGIEPGTELTVIEHTPIGMLTVEIADDQQSLPNPIADTIQVHPVAATDESSAEVTDG